MNWMFNDYNTDSVPEKPKVWRILYTYITTDGKEWVVEYDKNGGTGDVRLNIDHSTSTIDHSTSTL